MRVKTLYEPSETIADIKKKWLVVGLGLMVCGYGTVLADEAVGQALRERVERLRETGQLTVDGVSLAAIGLIPEIYERRGFEAAWTRQKQIDALVQAVEDSYAQGLDPADYHIDQIRSAAKSIASGERIAATRRADIDLLLTDALARLGYHLRFGKVNPEELDPDWNFNRELAGKDPSTVIQEAIDSDSLTTFIDRVLPRGFFYHRLKTALAQYRGIQAAGGWPTVVDGPALKVGMTDDRVSTLAKRLQASGDLDESFAPADARLFGQTVDQAVKRFQYRHGLSADGVVGAGTLAALNVPVEARVEQIRINLERARWVFDDIEDEFIFVNIAEFRVFLVRNREYVWTARAQVGKPYRKTPVFKSTLKYVVFNPTWTVTPGILAKDIMPRAKRDPGYLQTKNIDIRDNNGAIVDPKSIDWEAVSARSFPYKLVQRPGPTNALGQVKFIFPNKYFVFLHDTPSKALFERPDRAFSSGCIRVQSPLDLAAVLLESKGWNREKVDAVIASQKTETVFLAEPMTVMLLYLTVTVDGDGTIRFEKDIYGRDQRIGDGLKAPFRVSPPRS